MHTLHTCMHAYIHTYITYTHAYIHTYIHCITLHTYMHCKHTYIHIRAYIHTYIHTYIYIYIYIHTYIHLHIRGQFCSSMKASLQRFVGGGPDPPSQPASDHCSQGSNVPLTPVKRQLFQAWNSESSPATPGSKRQCVLPFAVTPRSTPRSPLSSPGAPSTLGDNEVFLGPALKALMRSARTNPEQASLIQKVVQEQKALYKSQRQPGELAPKPLNPGGARETQPGAERSGRPPDPRGHRVGTQGYLTPGAKKNNRPEGQVVLRRDVSAPARLRMAQAVTSEGVHCDKDLQQLLPETWRRLEVQFARSGKSNGKWKPVATCSCCSCCTCCSCCRCCSCCSCCCCSQLN